MNLAADLSGSTSTPRIVFLTIRPWEHCNRRCSCHCYFCVFHTSMVHYQSLLSSLREAAKGPFILSSSEIDSIPSLPRQDGRYEFFVGPVVTLYLLY
ncbi:Uncharacterized protein HZ326_8506 [Fusarium oxysporum f. sp. albedinis]|nr:Uncharacterized protein HZ326_8506 [Fusarium oxysporum f. sp. albedinis]